MTVVVAWSAVVSLVILVALDKLVGLRVSVEHEKQGLDSSVHGVRMLGDFRYDTDSPSTAAASPNPAEVDAEVTATAAVPQELPLRVITS